MQFYNHNAMRVSNKWKEHSKFTFNRLPQNYIKLAGNAKKKICSGRKVNIYRKEFAWGYRINLVDNRKTIVKMYNEIVLLVLKYLTGFVFGAYDINFLWY